MNNFPAGAASFQLPKPLKGVVYATEDGRVWVMTEGRALLVWTPPRAVPVSQEDGS